MLIPGSFHSDLFFSPATHPSLKWTTAHPLEYYVLFNFSPKGILTTGAFGGEGSV